MRIVLYYILSFLSFQLFAQLNVEIQTENEFYCSGSSIVLKANITNGEADSFAWIISNSSYLDTINTSTDSIEVNLVNSVLHKYYTDIDTTFFNLNLIAYDSTYSDSVNKQIGIISLPGAELRKIHYDYCCGFGNISLALAYPWGNFHNGGKWSVIDAPASYVTGQALHADSLCTSTVSKHWILYEVQNDSTLCFNSDSVQFTLNPLPQIKFNQRVYCQDVNEINLANDLLIHPSPATIISGIPSWKCVECNGNDFNTMLQNRSPSSKPDYWLMVDKAHYNMKNSRIDTIILEFSFINQFGCKTLDTVSFELWHVPEIKFRDGRDLCWNEGEIDLTELFDVNWHDGFWTFISNAQFRDSTELGTIKDSSLINTKGSIKLKNAQQFPNSFGLRYTHYASGCAAYNDTSLIIHPGYQTELSVLDPIYCSSSADIQLSATPDWANSKWSASDSAAIEDRFFKPSKVTDFDNRILITYHTPIDTITGCVGEYYLETRVEAQQIAEILDSSRHYYISASLDSFEFQVLCSTQHLTNSLVWNIVPLTGGSANYLYGQESAWFSVDLDNSSATEKFFVSISTGVGDVCPTYDDILFIEFHIHPLYIDNINQEEVRLYPNPAHDQIRIYGREIKGFDNWFITNLQGQIILQNNHSEKFGTIDISQLNPGQYLLYIESRSQKSYVKFQVR